MIRFSAIVSVVVVALALLVVGAVSGTLMLVYLAIGLAGLALLMLIAGVLVWRDEIFGPSVAAKAVTGRPEGQFGAAIDEPVIVRADERTVTPGAVPAEASAPARTSAYAGAGRGTAAERGRPDFAARDQASREDRWRRDGQSQRDDHGERDDHGQRDDRSRGTDRAFRDERDMRARPGSAQPGREDLTMQRRSWDRPAGDPAAPAAAATGIQGDGRYPRATAAASPQAPIASPGEQSVWGKAEPATNTPGGPSLQYLRGEPQSDPGAAGPAHGPNAALAHGPNAPARGPNAPARGANAQARGANAQAASAPAPTSPTVTSPGPASPAKVGPGSGASGPGPGAVRVPAARSGGSQPPADQPAEPVPAGQVRSAPVSGRTQVTPVVRPDAAGQPAPAGAGQPAGQRPVSPAPASVPPPSAAPSSLAPGGRAAASGAPGPVQAGPSPASAAPPTAPPVVPASGRPGPADARPGQPAPATSPSPAEQAGSATGSAMAASAETSRQVTVVPGIARYHNADCILIRFLGEEDLETMTLGRAEETGCAPCRACRPEKELANA